MIGMGGGRGRAKAGGARRRIRPYSPVKLPTGRFAEPPAPSFLQAAWLVARRDIEATARSKAFVISTVVTLASFLAGFLVVGFLSGPDSRGGTEGADTATPGEPSVTLAAGPDLAELAQSIPGAGYVEAADDDDAIAKVAAGAADAALLTPLEEGGSVRVVGDAEAPSDVVDFLTAYPEVTLLNPPRVSEGAGYFLSLAFGIVYLMMGAMFGQVIAQNTVVEKQTRIVEILLAAVPARAMLAGKILGGSILAVGETLAIVAVCLMGMSATGLTELLTLLTAPMWWYVAFFLVGFVMYAAMFCAAGALVSRLEDLGSASSPILMLVMAPYILVLALNGSKVGMAVLSYVPFTAPVAMPVRMVLGDAGALDAIGSLAILAATAVLVGMATVRIYVNSVLQTGSRIKVRHALRAAAGS